MKGNYQDQLLWQPQGLKRTLLLTIVVKNKTTCLSLTLGQVKLKYFFFFFFEKKVFEKIFFDFLGGPTASTAATNEDQNDKFYIRANSVEEKEQSGWGAPPPSNPNGWGQPPPKIGNWQQPPPNVAQPPPQPQTPQENPYGKSKL